MTLPEWALESVDLRAHIRDIPDFQKSGICFKDITPLLLDPRALNYAVGTLSHYATDLDVDFVLAAEARGFILGGAIAARIGAGFVPARKPGKLPSAVASAQYALEYGLDSLEIHSNAIPDGARVLVHDDLLATGGTAGALCELVERAGATVVGCAFVIELTALRGRERLERHEVISLIELG